MRTLIVPCAGTKRINGFPRWLAPLVNGQNVVSECIRQLDFTSFSRIIVTVLREDDASFDAVKKLSSSLKFLSNVEFCLLEKKTGGPAETIERTLIDKNVKGPIAIKDAGIIIKPSAIQNSNFLFGINLFNYQADLENVRNKSFITVNDQNDVLDIIEKNVKSGIISLGYYGFEQASDFLWAYNSVSQVQGGSENLFVSHIIDYLIGMRQTVFTYCEPEFYESVEDENDYYKYINRRCTYFIDYSGLDDDCFLYLKHFVSKGASLIFLCPDKQIGNAKATLISKGILNPIIISFSYGVSRQILSSPDEIKNKMLTL